MATLTANNIKRRLGIPLGTSAVETAVLDGAIAGTAVASKALVLGAAKDIATITSATITTLTSTTGNITTVNATTVAATTHTGTTWNKLTLTAPAAGATLTLADGSSLITVGAYAVTFTATGTTGVTLPTAGTLATLAGIETLTNKTLSGAINSNTKRCSAQLDKTDTTLTNITGLTGFTVVTGATYRFRYVLKTTCGGTGGTKVAFKYNTTVINAIDYTTLGYTASAVAVANGTTGTDQASQIASNTAAILVVGEGTFTVTTGGTLDLQFAENSANSTSSVLVGSTMDLERIA